MQNKEFYTQTFDMFLEAYGKDAEINMCIEEMSELTKELIKYIRYENYNAKFQSEENLQKLDKIKKNIIEECADVLICASQIRHIFGEEQVDEIMESKIQRGNDKVKIDLDRIKNKNINGSKK